MSLKLEILFIVVIGAFLYDTYYDGKYSKQLLSYKKYYKMIGISFIIFCVYVMLKKNPSQGKQMLVYANNMVKYMPMNRNSLHLLNPILDLTSSIGNGSFNQYPTSRPFIPPNLSHNTVMNSGGGGGNINNGSDGNKVKATKRSVSETKKKYVAYQQDWKCGKCSKKLPYTFEVDHKIRLEYGGSNDTSNLVALCRDCHGEKTAMENM